jgi:hypothetical protein
MGHRRVYTRGHKVRYERRRTNKQNTDWENIAIPVALLLVFLAIILFSGSLPSQGIAKTGSSTTSISNVEDPSGSLPASQAVPGAFSIVNDGDLAGNDVITKAKSISMDVPMKGNSLLGTTGSMQDMYSWQLDSGNQLIQGFTQSMSLLGLQDQDYVVNMQTTLDQGMSLANKNWENR